MMPRVLLVGLLLAFATVSLPSAAAGAIEDVTTCSGTVDTRCGWHDGRVCTVYVGGSVAESCLIPVN